MSLLIVPLTSPDFLSASVHLLPPNQFHRSLQERLAKLAYNRIKRAEPDPKDTIQSDRVLGMGQVR